MNRTLIYDHSLFSIDPIFWDIAIGGWWFWDETWSCSIGPYYSEWEAEKMLSLYCFHLLGGAELLYLNTWKACSNAGAEEAV